MSTRLILAAAAASLVPLAPAAAHMGGGDGLLSSPPQHASAGACYARVRQDARWRPPGPAHGRWVLRPGSAGPTWCLVSEPGAPPVLVRPERHGWIRVSCAPRVRPVHVARAPRPHAPRPVYAPVLLPPPPMAHGLCCNLASAPPPPPPVVTIRTTAPTPPRSPWLGWSGKSIY